MSLELFKKTHNLDYFYGNNFYDNLDIMHNNIYYKNLDEETVITNEKYGGDSGHSGFSFGLMKHTLKRYHAFLEKQLPNYIEESLPEYKEESLPKYKENIGCFSFFKFWKI